MQKIDKFITHIANYYYHLQNRKHIYQMCSVSSMQGSKSIDMEELFCQTSHLDTRGLLKNANQISIPWDSLKNMTKELIWENGGKIKSKHDYTRQRQILSNKYGINPSNMNISYAYKCIIGEDRKKYPRQHKFESYMKVKKVRSNSGVLVITVLTSGKIFSCRYNCYYCPDEPGQPRSYLMKEPAVARANNNNFDPYEQFMDRATALFIQGCHVDKIEIIVEGGTIACYQKPYLKWFMGQLYQAANDFYTPSDKRPPVISQEQMELMGDNCIDNYLQDMKTQNMSALTKIIGLTLETRPDCINQEEIEFFLAVGCTRVQLGIQTTHDDILKKLNRQCTTQDAINAIRILKDTGFKVDIHLMPDLPFTTPELDIEMFMRVLADEGLQVDDWKIYPCMVTDFTEIKNWYNEGLYMPYSETNLNDLIRVLKIVKRQIHPWIRINRLVRDIPIKDYVVGGLDRSDLRDIIQKQLIDEGTSCKCIRCREVKNTDFTEERMKNVVRKIRTYHASGGIEYFISMEDADDETLYGFIRLRLCKDAGLGFIPELKNAALVRELHVYGEITPAWSQADEKKHVQHRGFGKLLVRSAEEIASHHGFGRVAIISGVGVRNYYAKQLDYVLEGSYMTKNITANPTTIQHLYPLLTNNNWQNIHTQWGTYYGSQINKRVIVGYIRASMIFKNPDFQMILVALFAVLIYFMIKYWIM
jgi:ELP3 family radical SAM enzyme/protein acetyltransferase